MDQPQERRYSFQTRIFRNSGGKADYIPGMPTMYITSGYVFETVATFVNRYNTSKRHWEYLARAESFKDSPVTKDNLCELGQLTIPAGVNKHSWIKPSEDWFKERPDIYEYWVSKMKSFRGGEEIIEAEALSDAFRNDPDSTFIHVTKHEIGKNLYILEPTLGNGPSQPVLPPSRAQQSVQPSLKTAGFLLAKPNRTPDLQRHSKLNVDPINPNTSSSISQLSMTNRASQLLPRSNGNQQIVQQIVHSAANTTGFSSATPVQIHHRRNRSRFSDDPIDSDTSF
ncbi:uncharacterized protein EAF01_004495 [Botrytis porri]|uniref:Uncharacterized protein n=1 Tax=Botrytis porri TaxID=87229 RepID=A0A4Z1KVT6_9HELO|nr:uncharacterized protein EAF01_004495 [Botrytis porri]KAF7908740.1 hypothetical protein EAF01_004495 [Botrytis porri]TGO88652.1 hypothetical protein BPOR_0149g00060 [Botrytis porri]